MIDATMVEESGFNLIFNNAWTPYHPDSTSFPSHRERYLDPNWFKLNRPGNYDMFEMTVLGC